MHIWAIGDIHGRLDLLTAALNDIRCADGPDAMIVCLGDYVDRGPESRGVIELLMSQGATVTCLKGNHEAMLVDAHRFGGSAAELWLSNGGRATMASYDGKALRNHVEWMDALPIYKETEHHIFVHAGMIPGVPLSQHSDEELMWIRDRFLRGKPSEFSKHVVHGHTSMWDGDEDSVNLGFAEHRTGLDVGAWMNDVLVAALFDTSRPGGPIRTITVTAQ